MQANNASAAEAGGAAAAAAAAVAPMLAAPAAGNLDEPAAGGTAAEGAQHGHGLDGEAAGEAVDLASLSWPLPLPEDFLLTHRDGGKPATQQQIQLWVAATLQVLQASRGAQACMHGAQWGGIRSPPAVLNLSFSPSLLLSHTCVHISAT